MVTIRRRYQENLYVDFASSRRKTDYINRMKKNYKKQRCDRSLDMSLVSNLTLILKNLSLEKTSLKSSTFMMKNLVEKSKLVSVEKNYGIISSDNRLFGEDPHRQILTIICELCNHQLFSEGQCNNR